MKKTKRFIFRRAGKVGRDIKNRQCRKDVPKGNMYQGFKVDSVLMESWFSCEAYVDAVLSVKKHTVHLIGIYKIAKPKFLYNYGMYSQANRESEREAKAMS